MDMIGHRLGIIRGVAQNAANVEKVTLARSVTWNWAGIILSGLVSFITMPVMIHRLGSFYYGIWVLLNTFVGYYGLLDFGISAGLRRFTSRLNGANDADVLRQIVAAALHLNIATAVVIIAITALVAYFLPRLVTLPASSAQLAQRVFLLIGLSVAIMFPARTLAACLHGLQRFDLSNLGSMVAVVLRGGCIVGALYMGFGVMAVAWITVAAALGCLVFYFAAVQWVDRKLFARWAAFSWGHMRELLVFSSFVFLNMIGDYFRFQLDSIVIARYLTVALVTPFSVAANLMGHFMNVLYAISTPLMVEQSRLDGAQRHDESRTFFMRGTRLTATFALLGGVLLICNGRLLLQVWLGRDLLIAYPVLVTLTVAYVIDLGQGPSINLLRSRGRHRPMAWWTLAEGIANLALSIYLGRRYGILGVALGTAVPVLITKLFVQPWYVLRIAEVRVTDYVASIAAPLFVASLCVAVYKVVPAHSPNFLTLCFGIAWQTALFGLLAYVFVLNADERSAVKRFMHHLRPVMASA
jgi:O-antigen/teichoic acid export membrane protein